MEDKIKLKQDYCVELLKVIDNSFRDYGLDFRGESSLVNTDIPGYILSSYGSFEFCAMAVNDKILSEVIDGDEEAFKNFIRDIVNNFLRSNSDKLKVELDGDPTVEFDQYNYGGKYGDAMFVEFWLEEIDK